MPGNPNAGGRPKGRQVAFALPEGWMDGPPVSDDELLELRNKMMKALMTAEKIGQMERTTLLRILGGWKKGDTDSGRKEVQELAAQVFGFTPQVVEGGKE